MYHFIFKTLTGRGQHCRVNGVLSKLIHISLSTVQGSAISLTLLKIDLYALSKLNNIFKYADNTTLLVPPHSDVEVIEEFDYIKAQAYKNCLQMNLGKTKEIVFKRRRVQYFHLPTAILRQ